MKILYKCVIILIYLILSSNFIFAGEKIKSIGMTELYFSPNGGATKAIVEEIDNAKDNIFMQAYSYTSIDIKDALIRAKQRNVQVIIIVDKGQLYSKYSMIKYSNCYDIPTFIDYEHKIAHNKIIIIDSNIVITGSFNFSSAAEKYNAENLLIIKGNNKLTHFYVINFYSHLDHSIKYFRRIEGH